MGEALPPPAPPPAPDPSALDLPDDPALLEAWFVALLRAAQPETMAFTLFKAEVVASGRFDSRTVVAAMRRVMSHAALGVLAKPTPGPPREAPQAGEATFWAAEPVNGVEPAGKGGG